MKLGELELAKKVKSPCCHRYPSHASPHWDKQGNLLWVNLRCPWCRDEYEVRRSEVKALPPVPDLSFPYPSTAGETDQYLNDARRA